MQLDMHYYGTYAMARAAGLTPATCREIAFAAQFVDDNAKHDTIHNDNGAIVGIVATAHHAMGIENLDEADQRLVWVPFHFLPGGEGDSYTERLKARKDSAIAREMIGHHLDLADREFATALMGVAAHVYGDTFSHYGFSGVSSRRNKVDQGSIELHGLSSDIRRYITGKASRFWRKHGSQGGLFANFRASVRKQGELASAALAEEFSGALGHGPVHTYPDRPYLSWSFAFESPRGNEKRDNHADYLDACQALHAMFRRFAERRPDLSDGGGQPFDGIRDLVTQVLAVERPKSGRIAAWQDAADSGRLFGRPERIPDYDENAWHDQRDSFADTRSPRDILELPVYRFYQAAAVHRTYVLRDLLPRHDLLVN